MAHTTSSLGFCGVIPSHHTSPFSVIATLVKRTLLLTYSTARQYPREGQANRVRVQE